MNQIYFHGPAGLVHLFGRFYITRQALWIDCAQSLDFVPHFIPIRWYGMLYLVAYVICFHLIKRAFKKYKIHFENPKSREWNGWLEWAKVKLKTGSWWQIFTFNSNTYNSFLESSMLSGVLGGRLWFLVQRFFEEGTPIWIDMFKVWEGGMAIQGGLVLGFLGGALWLTIHGRLNQIAHISDIFASYLPIGSLIGRWGNFLNREFMWNVPVLNIPSCVFASLTEGLMSLIFMQIVLRKLYKRKFLTTAIFFMNYSAIRLVNDVFRQEPGVGVFNLKLSQYTAITTFVLSCVLYTIYAVACKMRKSRLQ